MDTEENFDAHTPWRKTPNDISAIGPPNGQISYPYQMIEISVMYISICHLYIYMNLGRHLRLSLLTEMFQIEGERNLKRLPLK